MSFGQTIYGIISCMSWWHGSLEQSSMKLGSELVFDDDTHKPYTCTRIVGSSPCELPSSLRNTQSTRLPKVSKYITGG